MSAYYAGAPEPRDRTRGSVARHAALDMRAARAFADRLKGRAL